jgi:hypothetical protein
MLSSGLKSHYRIIILYLQRLSVQFPTDMEVLFCVAHHSSLCLKIDYILCLTEYQILLETFGVLECPAKVEIVQKLIDWKDSLKGALHVWKFIIYFGKKISNNNTLVKILPCVLLEATKTSTAQLQNEKCVIINFHQVRLSSKISFL